MQIGGKLGSGLAGYEQNSNVMKNDRIIIFDTTLRDGEQCPGASMNLREKLEVARQLARLKVDVIEAGFPVISEGDFASVQSIAKEIKGPVIAGLARCVPKDIDAAGEAIKPAGKKGRIHVFLATSKIHREFKLGKAQDEILRLAVEGVNGRSHSWMVSNSRRKTGREQSRNFSFRSAGR
jgi:2-isopropylmalate synthase